MQLHGSISQDLVRFGYESDYSWEVLLDGVESNDFASHLPEYWIKGDDLSSRRKNERMEVLNIVLRKLRINPIRFKKARNGSLGCAAEFRKPHYQVVAFRDAGCEEVVQDSFGAAEQNLMIGR